MGRLFTFGCSFTYYAWPTWANIAAVDKNCEFYNFGMAGIGNVGISQRILEADCKFNFTKDDKIMIMWTSWTREDKIIGYDYEAGGSIFGKYPTAWLKNNFHYADIIVKNSNAIIATNQMYKDLILWQGAAFKNDFMEVGDIEFSSFKDYDKEFYNSLIKMYDVKMPKYEFIGFEESGNKFSFDCLNDSHPDILDHLSIVNKIIPLKQKTKDITVELYNEVKQTLTLKKCTRMEKAQKIITNIVNSNYKDTFAKAYSYEALSSRIT